MRGIRRLAAVASALGAMALAAPPVHAYTVPLPNSMASTGDSITRAFDATWFGCFLTDCPQYSWSTGTSSSVNSQYARILVLNPMIRGLNYNDARSGAKMADLAGQMNTAAGQHVDYVTVLMGANDVCNSNVLNMTSTTDFQAQFASAMAGFFAQDPGAHVYVSSLPNVGQLYTLFQYNSSARSVWKAYNICQDVLPPGGTDATRKAVYDQEVAFNSILQSVCGQYTASCLYDGGYGFSYSFSASEVSTIDYFHPSVTGQKDVAALTWSRSYWAG